MSASAPPNCPKCKRPAMGIGRTGSGVKRLALVTVHHFQSMAICEVKMTWSDAQKFADSIAGDLGERK